MDEVERLAHEHKPKLIIAGGSAYPRIIDFQRFREICDEVGAYLLVDMAHFAGLVAGGAHPSPFPHAHVVTTTTHKTLRGPRGGVILTNDEELAKKFNSAVFPGMQGGPLMHVIAAKAVAFGEALRPSFRTYARNVVENAKALAETLKSRGLDIVSGGTDTHLMLVDLRPKQLTGKVAELALGRAHITCNKNGIPFDPQKPTVTSGIRLGTPAGTTRGFGIAEFRAGRRDDRRRARRAVAEKDRGRFADRKRGARQGEGIDFAFSDLSIASRLHEAGCRRGIGELVMRCPSCGSLDTQVKDSRPTEDSAVIRRRRVCLTCNFRFTTFERVQLRELTVIKRNGRRVPFDRDKLMRSVQIALRKRAVDPERIEQEVSKIVRELESQGENEVSSEAIGELVMEHLRGLDDVAYVRFASRLPQFPRGQGLPRRARRIVGRRRSQARRPRANERSNSAGLCEPDSAANAADDARFMAACLHARPARARQYLAQSGGRRGDRQGRRHRRPRLDATRRPPACRGRGAAPRQEGGAGRHACT